MPSFNRRRIVQPAANGRKQQTGARRAHVILKSDLSQPARTVRECLSRGTWLAANDNEHKRLRALLVA
jgi:hypothetical protein